MVYVKLQLIPLHCTKCFTRFSSWQCTGCLSNTIWHSPGHTSCMIAWLMVTSYNPTIQSLYNIHKSAFVCFHFLGPMSLICYTSSRRLHFNSYSLKCRTPVVKKINYSCRIRWQMVAFRITFFGVCIWIFFRFFTLSCGKRMLYLGRMGSMQ